MAVFPLAGYCRIAGTVMASVTSMGIHVFRRDVLTQHLELVAGDGCGCVEATTEGSTTTVNLETREWDGYVRQFVRQMDQ